LAITSCGDKTNKGAERRNKSRPRNMNFRIVFAVYCALSFPQFLQAASPSGYVIEWGWDPGRAIPHAPKLVCSNAIAVSAGMSHSLAVISDGTVFGWGGDLCGAASGIARSEPVAANGNWIVRLNGHILSNVIAVAATHYFSLGFKRDGTVVTWGWNYVPKDLTNAVSIAAAGLLNAAVRGDGTVVEWVSQKSAPDYPELVSIPELTNVVSIAVGESYHGTRNVALRKNGTVVNWGGESIHKDATPPVGLSNVIQIAAGSSHSLALKSDSTVVGWGWNKVGQAIGTPTTNSSDGLNFFAAGQVRIGGQILTNITSIAAGRGYSMALKSDGSVVAWGRMVNELYPVSVPVSLSNVVAIAAGDNFCLAITTNAAVAERFRR
jgi:alpha-tubulin suppressor-like RCC1 family protein